MKKRRSAKDKKRSKIRATGREITRPNFLTTMFDKVILSEEDADDVTIDATKLFTKVTGVKVDGTSVEILGGTDTSTPPEEVTVPLDKPVVLKARV